MGVRWFSSMGRHRDRREIEGLLARRERGGLTWSELSAESGVPRSTLQLWSRRFGTEVGRGKRSGFVRVEVVDRSGGHSPERLEIVLRSGHRLLVPRGFDANELRAVVAVLEPGC